MNSLKFSNYHKKNPQKTKKTNKKQKQKLEKKTKNKNKKAKTNITAMSSDGHSNNSGTINVVLVSLL